MVHEYIISTTLYVCMWVCHSVFVIFYCFNEKYFPCNPHIYFHPLFLYFICQFRSGKGILLMKIRLYVYQPVLVCGNVYIWMADPRNQFIFEKQDLIFEAFRIHKLMENLIYSITHNDL